MKRISKWIKAHPNIVYVLLFVILLWIHLCIKANYGDDLVFKNHLSENLFDFLQRRYNGWSSRVLIEGLMMILLGLPKIFWCIADSFCITVTAYGIAKLFTKNTLKSKILSCVCLGLIPLSILGNTGWYATTLNYSFPVAMLVVSFFPLKNFMEEKKMRWWIYVIYIVATVFACNQEQTCAIFVAVNLVLIGYFAVKKKRISKFMCLQILLGVGMMIFALTAPGNSVRIVSETATWYPSYASFGLKQKILLGVNGVMARLLSGSSIFLVFVLVLGIYGWKIEKCFVKVVSIVPFVFSVIMIFHSVFERFFPYIKKLAGILEAFKKPNDLVAMMSGNKWVLFCICGVIFLCVGIAIYGVLDDVKKKDKSIYPALMTLAYFVGLSSAMMLAFSPTFYASNIRIYLFFYIAMVSVLVYLLDMLKNRAALSVVVVVFVIQTVSLGGLIV